MRGNPSLGRRWRGAVKYAVFSFDGYGLPIAWQLQWEGHDVVVGQVEAQDDVISALEVNVPPESDEARSRRLSLFDGLLEKLPAAKLIERVKKSKDAAEWFSFFDLNHLFRQAAELRESGCHGNFPTEEDHRYEIDRNLAKEFVQSHYPDVRVAPKCGFRKMAEARKFLEASDELWVLKGLAEDARTVLPDVDDPELARGQILDALRQNPDEYESAGFLLELRIPHVLELTPQRVYLDGVAIANFMTVENKPMGAGNVGPMTDCAQDVGFAIDGDDKISRLAFPPIVDEIARQRKGLFYWDASLLLDGRSGKLYFGEFCANRPGYNSLFTEMTLAGGAAKYFECAVGNRCPYPPARVAASIRVFNPHLGDEGRPLAGARLEYKAGAEGDLWPIDVRKDRGRLVTAGYKDTVAVVTGVGHSVTEAATRAQRRVDELSFEGAYYRPKFDLLSREYPTSILNRIEYGLRRGFYRLGFGLT